MLLFYSKVLWALEKKSLTGECECQIDWLIEQFLFEFHTPSVIRRLGLNF